MASGHTDTGRPGEPIRMFDASFTARLLVEHHRRCHDCAEYLAQVAATVGSDTAMTARELSTCIFEVLELIRAHHRPGRVDLTLLHHPSYGVEVRASLPADEALAEEYAVWLNASLEGRDMLDDPRPGDGLLELVAVHNARVSSRHEADRLTLSMHVTLNKDEEA